MVVKAFLIGLITMFGFADDFFGASMLCRSIVLGPLVGLVLGDFHTGIVIGGTLELIWMGIISVGAAIPPDIVTGGVLGTAFAILSGKGPGVALALAVPIAMLAQSLKTLIYILRSGLLRKVDAYAEDGNTKGIERIHLLAFLMILVTMFILSFSAVLFGSSVISALLKSIPSFIIDGLTVTSGLLPALGFAMLTSLMINKKLAPFFFLGFLLSTYLKLSTIPVAILGIIIGFIIIQSKSSEEVDLNV